MNIIKKIALTASILLFVLAQVFSFYVIFISHQEKIELLKEKEGKFFASSVRKFSLELEKPNQAAAGEDYVVRYCFRKNMMENCALYKGKTELFNNSPYEFDVEKTDWEKIEYPSASIVEKLNGRYLLVFYEEYQSNKTLYYIYYAIDVTAMYSKSFLLIWREMFVSILVYCTVDI